MVEDRRRNHSWHTNMFMNMEFAIQKDYANGFLDKKGPPGSGDTLRQLKKEVGLETDQGSCFDSVLQVVVGRIEGGDSGLNGDGGR